MTTESTKDLATRALAAALNADDNLTTLIEKTKTDAGAPFEEDSLQLLAQLKIAKPADFERWRKKLKDVGCRLGELDKALDRFLVDDPALVTTQQGTPLELSDIEPWEEEVDGGEVLAAVAETIRRHVVLPESTVLAVTLWVMFTHVFEEFTIAPILAIQSPEKGCGKTTLMDVLENLVARALLAANITPSATFRSIEMAKPTLLIDEADTFVRDNDELRGILNAGYRKGGSVIRSVGEDHMPTKFDVWCPKALASIGDLPDTLQDRAVVITLQRKRADETVEPFRSDRTDALSILARKIARWAQDSRDTLARHEPYMPPELFNRVADNWRPLLAIADIVGEQSSTAARLAACELSMNGKAERESIGTQLLTDIRDIFTEDKANKFSSSYIVDSLKAIEGRPWADYGRKSSGITQNSLARLLKPFGIAPATQRFADETAKGYDRAQFTEAWERYLPSCDKDAVSTVTPSQSVKNQAFCAANEPSQSLAV